MTAIKGPYYRTGHYIRGQNDRVVAMVDCWDQHGTAERDALISDLIDFLTQRDVERAAVTATGSKQPPPRSPAARTRTPAL